MTMKNFRAVDMPSGPAAPASAPVEPVVEPVALITDEGATTIADSSVNEGGTVTDADAPTV